MKLEKTNVAVFIENESHLQQARELLERHGEGVYGKIFCLTEPLSDYLYFHMGRSLWGLSYKASNDIEITLSELEEILKEEV